MLKTSPFPILVLKCKHIAKGNWKAISSCLAITWIMSSCLSPEKGHCIVFLSKTIYMYSQSSVSLKPGQDQSQTNSIYL